MELPLSSEKREKDKQTEKYVNGNAAFRYNTGIFQ
jgi:hypothetical protein